MACQSCQKARQAVSASFKALVMGDAKAAVGEASKAISAAAEKAESMRVRAITGRR